MFRSIYRKIKARRQRLEDELAATREPMIKLSTHSYRELFKAGLWAIALNEAGVYSWDGVDAAKAIYRRYLSENNFPV